MSTDYTTKSDTELCRIYELAFHNISDVNSVNICNAVLTEFNRRGKDFNKVYEQYVQDYENRVANSS